jgi:protein-disulfide isomerase
MAFLSRRVSIFASSFFLISGMLLAQDWKTATTLAGVDFTGLSVKQKATALKVLRESGCSCGCGRTMAQCRVEDPSCSFSVGLANVVVQAIKDGKTPQQALEAANTSRFGASHPQTVLEEAVKLNVAGAPVTGPADAPITIVEFSDFQCPYCIQAVPEIEALLKVYPKQVKLIFKQFPLEIHSDAYRAASAALAAQKQEKFWDMHYALFAHHDDLSLQAIMKIAQELKLDITRLQKDMDSKEIRDTIAKDLAEGSKAGVEGTPTIFINGQRYNGRIELATLRGLIGAELKKSPAKTERASR